MESKKERVLFLTTMFPYPLDGGGKIRAFNNLQALSVEYDIDLVCFDECEVNKEYINEIQKYCLEVRVIQKVFSNSSSKVIAIKNILTSLIKNSPFIIEKFYDKKCKNELKILLEKYNYKAVFFEHLSITCYKYLFNKDIKQILSQQNCEYMLMKRRTENEKNIFKKMYTYLEYKKLKKYEVNTCSEFDEVIMLSEEDESMLKLGGYNKENISIIPIGVNDKVKKKSQYSENGVENILFMGTMTWYPNEQGILWFIDNVWNEIKNKYPQMNLYVVGKSPSAEVLKKKSVDGVIVTGYVDDIEEYIEKCDICIIPLFIGGGMRVKILESMARGLPCISTSIGAEGIAVVDKENIMIANDSLEFIESIDVLSRDNDIYIKIISNSNQLVSNKYSTEVIRSSLNNIINMEKNYD